MVSNLPPEYQTQANTPCLNLNQEEGWEAELSVYVGDRQTRTLPSRCVGRVYVILTADWNAADRPDQGRYVPGGTARH